MCFRNSCQYSHGGRFRLEVFGSQGLDDHCWHCFMEHVVFTERKVQARALDLEMFG